MNSRRTWRFVLNGAAVLIACLVGVRLAMPVSASAKALSGHNFGQSPAGWQSDYWYWAYGGFPFPTDGNGNTVDHNVVLMPLPDAPGDGTPGSIDVTLSSGQPFFLPFWALLGQSYPDGSSDPVIDEDVFRTLDIVVEVDGVPVITSDNVMNYYSAGDFDPVIPFGDSPFIRFQGISMTHTPLTPGQHTITLDVVNAQPVFGSFIIEYHNTWNITVNPGR